MPVAHRDGGALGAGVTLCAAVCARVCARTPTCAGVHVFDTRGGVDGGVHNYLRRGCVCAYVLPRGCGVRERALHCTRSRSSGTHMQAHTLLVTSPSYSAQIHSRPTFALRACKPHIHRRKHTRTHTHARTHTRTHTHARTHARTRTCTLSRTHTHIHTHTQAHAYAPTNMHPCARERTTHARTHRPTHAHRHTRTHKGTCPRTHEHTHST